VKARLVLRRLILVIGGDSILASRSIPPRAGEEVTIRQQLSDDEAKKRLPVRSRGSHVGNGENRTCASLECGRRILSKQISERLKVGH
jgi:hypothetical protein